MPDVGLIIPVRDHWDYVIRTIDTAARHTPEALVLVMDDASTEWSDDLPRRLASLVAPGQLLFHRFHTHGGLTRSWNAGLRHCRDRGLTYAVPANSDLAFSPGWWTPLRCLLDARTASFVGPLSNAPGHQLEQDVRRLLPSYATDDTDTAIAACAAHLAAAFGGEHERAKKLNGFLVAGRTADYWSLALSPDAVYDPRIPFDGNEDDFHRRAVRQRHRLAIAHSSFVFHYKGVSRDTSHLVRPHKQDKRPGHRRKEMGTQPSDLPLASTEPIFVEER